MNRFNKLLKRINDIDDKLDCMINLENDRKRRILYSKNITLFDCCGLIPFDLFDLAFNGKLYRRCCTKEDLLKIALNGIYGFTGDTINLANVIDVRISLRESLVDLIVEKKNNE